jgi:hypothetical protein
MIKYVHTLLLGIPQTEILDLVMALRHEYSDEDSDADDFPVLEPLSLPRLQYLNVQDSVHFLQAILRILPNPRAHLSVQVDTKRY